MFIVFGWKKIVEPVQSLLKTYCYRCQRDTQWVVLRESEWVTLFFLKVFPFINKHHLVCDNCSDTFKLDKRISRQVLDPQMRNQELHDELVSALEKHQFQGLTEHQINYKKSQLEMKRNE